MSQQPQIIKQVLTSAGVATMATADEYEPAIASEESAPLIGVHSFRCSVEEAEKNMYKLEVPRDSHVFVSVIAADTNSAFIDYCVMNDPRGNPTMVILIDNHACGVARKFVVNYFAL